MFPGVCTYSPQTLYIFPSLDPTDSCAGRHSQGRGSLDPRCEREGSKAVRGRSENWCPTRQSYWPECYSTGVAALPFFADVRFVLVGLLKSSLGKVR